MDLISMRCGLLILISVLYFTSCRLSKDKYVEEESYSGEFLISQNEKPCRNYMTCQTFTPQRGVQSDYNIFKLGYPDREDYYFYCMILRSEEFVPENSGWYIIDTVQYFCPEKN